MNSELEKQVNLFLKKNFPQIEMHGGEYTVNEANIETGHVSIQLTGACDGCGISSMTIEAIKRKVLDQIDVVHSITVTTG